MIEYGRNKPKYCSIVGPSSPTNINPYKKAGGNLYAITGGTDAYKRLMFPDS
jgi:hypothetical protein